jgi:hypothetical protein
MKLLRLLKYDQRFEESSELEKAEKEVAEYYERLFQFNIVYL